MSFKRTRLKSALPKKVTSFPPSQRSDGASEGSVDPDGILPEDKANQESSHGHTDPLGSVNEPQTSERSSTQTGQRTQITRRRLHRRAVTLDVLQQPIQAGMKKVFDLRKLLIVIGLTCAVLLLPQPEGLSVEGHRALALFVFTGSILALEPAPLPIAALLVPICRVALQIDMNNSIAPLDAALQPFGRPVLFLILGSLFLAEALRKHGLTRRLALYAIVFSGGHLRMLLFGLMLITSSLSMWVLNTATAAVLIPVAITIAQQVERPEDAQGVLKLLILGIAYSSSFGAIATIMGSGENAIASGQSEPPISFLTWMGYGLPIVLILLPLSWFLLMQSFRLPSITIDTEPASKEIERLGVLTNSEKKIVMALLASASLWISGSWLEAVLNLPQNLLSSAVVAIGAVAVLSVEEVIDWNDLKGVNWGVFFVIGAGLTLGNALEQTGAGTWFANQLAPFLEGLPYSVVIAAMMGICFTLTQFMNNVTLGAILAPILIKLGEASGIPPATLLMPAIISLALAYTLPAASARMTLVAVTGAVERQDMVRSGLIVGIPSVLTIYGFFVLLQRIGMI
ncbi:MAG: DASS family sodium-coupled anion symporter [Chloroflexota bacterium]